MIKEVHNANKKKKQMTRFSKLFKKQYKVSLL